MNIAHKVKKAYIEPIRSVVLVDENFLTLTRAQRLVSERILTARADEGKCGPDDESQRPPAGRSGPLELDIELELCEAARARSWFCDVVTDPTDPEGLIERADLIVLDYHLTGDNSCKESIQIIQNLSRSSHANIVIVYTNEVDLGGAKRRIAAHLRGVRRSCRADADLIDDNIETFSEVVSGVMIDDFLCGKPASNEELIAFATNSQLNIEQLSRLFEAYLRQTYYEASQAPEISEVRSLRISTEGEPLWVQCGNVFVSLVGKSQNKGEAVFKVLEQALESWSPPLLVAGLAYARHLFIKGGFRIDSDFLAKNRHLHVGLLTHAVANDDAMSTERAVRNLFERLLSSVTEDVISELAPLVAGEIRRNPNLNTFDYARGLANETPQEDPQAEKDAVYHALNAFLCSERPERFCRMESVTTGTVFSCVRSEPGSQDLSYWVCVTPACDMVVRESPREEDLRTFSALRVKKVGLRKALKNATYCQHIFIDNLGHPLVLEVGENRNVRSLPADTMHAVNMATLERDSAGTATFSAYIYCDGMSRPKEPRKMTVVGQLRQSYASRLLQEAGDYGARIGVDFVKPHPS